MAMVRAVVSSFIFLILTIHIVLTSVLATNTNPRKLVTKLIYRDSISSPNYSPSDTFDDRVKHIIESSISRFHYLSEMSSDNRDLRSTPWRIGNLFFVKFWIGQLPVPQLAVMDTGSSLIWINCLPCNPCSFGLKSESIFDPSKSSTYSTIPCKLYNCTSCNKTTDHCEYKAKYAKGAGSDGILGKEQLTFETSDGGTNIVSDVVFGCGENNGNFSNDQATGVFGLGMDDPSLVAKLGSRFSYCVGPMNDPTYEFNQLVLGEGARMEGYSTPLEIYKGHYYLKMKGISLGERKLNIVTPQS